MQQIKFSSKPSCVRNRILVGFYCLILPGLLTGCFTLQTSTPPRTALEQLLLSTAADRAVRDLDLSWMKGKNVYVEDKYFESYDKGYAVGAIRDQISQSGALLLDGTNKADVIVEIRSGALSENSSTLLFGIPAMTVPVPLAGPLQTPELAFFKKQKADSIGKFALFAYTRDTGEHVQSVSPGDGKAKFHLYEILGVTWERTDIPELSRHKKARSSANGTNLVQTAQ
jgi:hypothetical protein